MTTPVVISHEDVLFGSGANPSGVSITIPSDCTAVYVFWNYWNASLGQTSTGIVSITLAGNAPAQSVTEQDHQTDFGNWSSAVGAAVWYNPSTGTQTLDVEWTYSPTEGAACAVVYVKDGDTTGWRNADADSHTVANDPGYASFSTASGDLILKYDAHYQGTASYPSLTTGWTNVDASPTGGQNYQYYRASYLVADAATEAVQCENEDWSAIAAVSIKPGGAGGGGGSILRQMMAHHGG